MKRIELEGSGIVLYLAQEGRGIGLTNKMLAYDFLIIGCPTWNIGQLQDDWDNHFLELEAFDLIGKKIAIFGLGDQYGYPESFCDAIGILGRKFIAQGAELYWRRA